MSLQQDAPKIFRFVEVYAACTLGICALIFASVPAHAKQPAQTKAPAQSKTPAQPKSPNQPKMYVLTQKSETMGDEVCYVAPDALRIDLKSTNCVIYVLKPFTEIEIVNTGQKTFFRGVLATWEGRPLKTRGFVRKNLEKGITWETLPVSEVCDVPAEHIIMLGPQPKNVYFTRARLDYWMARDLEVNPIVANAVAKVSGLAATKKLPLKYEFRTLYNTTANYFDTKKIETKALDAKLFVPPTNFKRVDMDLSVYFAVGESELDGVNSIIYRSDHADVALPTPKTSK